MHDSLTLTLVGSLLIFYSCNDNQYSLDYMQQVNALASRNKPADTVAEEESSEDEVNEEQEEQGDDDGFASFWDGQSTMIENPFSADYQPL
jgi:hypothetical protein